jgi:hypothetical protein
VIFLDSNIFIYAVGRAHPLRDDAQRVFVEASKLGRRLVTSAEVLQELLHVYLPVGRTETLDAALKLATETVDEIFPVSAETVLFARDLAGQHPGLTARDLLHLSTCIRCGVRELKTFDRELRTAFKMPT